MNKYKLYMILSIIVLVLSVSSSFAYYIWKSTSNVIVSLNVCTPKINIVGGSTINGVDMIPVLNKEEGTIKDIIVNLDNKCKSSVNMNLYLSFDLLPIELQEETFVYELYQGENQIKSGNLSSVTEGSTIQLVKDYTLNDKITSYKLYLYIDGTRDNPGDMAGKNFRFSLYAEGNGAIYGENIISPDTITDGTVSGTKFLNITDLSRDSIETIDLIEITEATNIPDDAIDISSLSDRSIMLWYNNSSNNNNLYNVTIGSTNGIIKANESARGMFSFLTNVTQINGLNRLDTSNTTNMTGMFYGCSSLTNIDLSSFNTSNVTNMAYMFRDCHELTGLDLSSFNTSKVTNMTGMFLYGFKLETITFGNNFDTSKVEKMNAMFADCKNLRTLDLSSFNTPNLTDVSGMFHGCYNLESIVFGSEFKTAKVTSLIGMFNYCESLTSLDLSSFDTSEVTDMSGMFKGCTNLNTIYVSELWNISSVTNLENMFYSCTSLVGAIPFDSTKIDKTMANYTTGYLTYKSNN